MPNRGLRSLPGNFRTDVRDFPGAGVGTLANRPLPRFPGRIYTCTDLANVTFVDDGKQWLQIPAPRMLAHSEAATQQTNSTAEWDAFNFNLPANSVVAGDHLELTHMGRLLNGSGLSISHRWRLYMQGTMIADSTSLAIATGANWRPYFVRFWLLIRAINSQMARWELAYQEADAAENAWGALVGLQNYRIGGNATAFTFDFSTVVNFRLSITASAANPSQFQVNEGYRLDRYLA